MAKEIERKFLVTSDSWRTLPTGDPTPGKPYCQGYIATAQAGQSVRVRIAGDQGFLTLKGPAKGITRAEFEYPIPVDEAQDMLEMLCKRPFIQKIRYCLPLGDVVWEIDEFEGENAGLIVAEVELRSEAQPFERPEWLGAEVSGQVRYYNGSLVTNPYMTWGVGSGE